MKIDKRTLTNLSYGDIYYLMLIIEKRQDILQNNYQISSNSDFSYYNYLQDLKCELMNYIDDKLKKIGKENNEKTDKKS